MPHSVITTGNHFMIHRLLMVNFYQIIPDQLHRIIGINTGRLAVRKRFFDDKLLHSRLLILRIIKKTFNFAWGEFIG
jgi:hypothetical protein